MKSGMRVLEALGAASSVWWIALGEEFNHEIADLVVPTLRRSAGESWQAHGSDINGFIRPTGGNW